MDIANSNSTNIDRRVGESSDGSCPKSKSNVFFDSFVCGYLAKHSEAQRLVEVKVHDCKLVVLRFNDIEKVSSIYCDYKEANGKLLNRDLKKRKDNLKNTLAQYVTDRSLDKVGSGKYYGKDVLEYEVKEKGLWQLLTSNFSVQKILCSQHVNFHACHGETSSDTGIGGMTQSDDQFNNQTQGHFRESHSVLSSEPSSDTGGVSQIDVQPADETHKNFQESRGVISSEPSSDTGDVSQSDVQPVDETMLAGLYEMDLDSLFNEFDDSFFNQMNLLPSENETSQPPQPLSTAVDEKIPELTIVPEFCSIEGGSKFVVCANQDLREGTYNVHFGDYGTCTARGFGSIHLDGCDNIPAARRRCGTHWITVHVFHENGKSIGNIPFEYRDKKANLCRKELVKNSSQGGSNLDNERHQQKKKSSSKSMECTGFNKKFKSDAVDMPMLMYLCDEMAKGGDEHFFSVLIKLGILADVFAYRSEYYKDVDVTAREHGHNELADMIAMSSRELPCVCDMEILTIGKLIDVVQQERSLANSGPIYSSHSDDDSNSCSSGYNGDCDSEDDQFEDNTDAIFGSCESQNNSENTGKIDVQWQERCEKSMVKLQELTGIPDTGKSSFTEHPVEMNLSEEVSVSVTDIEEGLESDVFWSTVSGKKNSYLSLLNDPSNYDLCPRLFHMTSSTGQFTYTEILSSSRYPGRTCPFPVLQDDLHSASQPEAKERTKGAYVVQAGLEPSCFTTHFPFWNRRQSIAEIQRKEGKKDGEKKPIEKALEALTKKFYSFQELTSDNPPDGVDPSKLETYLTDEEFEEIFAMPRDLFGLQPGWKQDILKKAFGLF